MNAPDLSDLRPAPRRAPALLLWSMFVVALAGIGLLVFDCPKGESYSAATRTSVASIKHPVATKSTK